MAKGPAASYRMVARFSLWTSWNASLVGWECMEHSRRMQRKRKRRGDRSEAPIRLLRRRNQMVSQMVVEMKPDEVTEQSLSCIAASIGVALTALISLLAAIACDAFTPANFGG